MKKEIIEKAETLEHRKLTELVKKSKAYWSYSSSQMQEWNDELTITHEYISLNEVLIIIL